MHKTKHYNNSDHVSNLIRSDYYKNLVLLRNVVEIACDEYFQELNAPKIDLYMISRGVSSPMGKGSDSEPIPLKFGDKGSYLVDSAQFGMEPLVINAFKIVYCYLPSFRGEDPDYMHLNQFYHCEAELRGDYKKAIEIAEGLIKYLINKVLVEVGKKHFQFKNNNFKEISSILYYKFPVITFDEAEQLLKTKGQGNLIVKESYGRTITRSGELMITELVSENKLPVWISKYDRDATAFYQQPDPENEERVLNADLVFPKIKNSIGGEFLGLGQRQNSAEKIIESMRRQDIKNVDSYKWYLELRNDPSYTTTSGFGLGIERLLTWMLGLSSIIDTSLYPVIKNEKDTF